MKNLHILQTLKILLDCERFIIGGSNAMKLHGIALPKEPDDLDVIIEVPKGDTLIKLEGLQEKNPNPKFTGKASMSYSFYFEDVKVDVWIKNELTSYPLLSYEGILVNSIADIVEAKMFFNRAKDWMQLMQWSQSIFDKSKFQSTLMEIGVSEDYNKHADEMPKKAQDDPLSGLWVPKDDDLPF